MNSSVGTGSVRQFDSRTSGAGLLAIFSDSGKIYSYAHSGNSQSLFININSMPATTGLIEDEDREIAAMTDAEILTAVRAMAGAWADRDDIDDNWLKDSRSSWYDRLDKFYEEQTDPV